MFAGNALIPTWVMLFFVAAFVSVTPAGVEDANAGERYVTAYSDWTTIKVTSEEEGLAVARWQKLIY